MLIHKGKKITAENITIQDVEEIFDWDKNVMLQHRLNLGKEYVEKHFPINKEEESRVKKILAKNIKLSDPKTFKSVKEPVTYEKMFRGEDPNKRVRIKNFNERVWIKDFSKKAKNYKVMNIYSRARKHLNMERVKELKEEKYIKNLERQQEIVLTEISRLWKEKNKHYDWRTGKELTEGMTTAAIGLVNLPAEGDVDILDTNTVYDGFDSSRSQNANYSRSGTTVTLVGTENQIVNGTHTFYNVARFVVDGSKSSTLKVTIQKGGGTSSWTDRDGASNFDDDVTLNVGDNDDFFAPLYNNTNLSSGTHLIRLPSNYKNLLISFEQFGKVGETGALRITNLSLQRRTPVSVLVPLDDPDASSFIRDGVVDTLSPGEKKKKLEQQLKASNQYLYKMFGEGMPSGATEIAEYEPQQSFEDLASETEKNFSDFATDARNPMGTGDQALDREMTALLASPLVQAAASQGLAALAALIGSIGTAAQIMRAIDAGKYGGEYGSDVGPGYNPEVSPGDRDTPSMDGRHQQERDAADQAIKDAEAQYGQDSEEARQARQNKNDTMSRQRKERKEKNVKPPIAREHYKPQGKVIKEKRKLKSPKGLTEQMTTAAIGLISLPAEGDVDLENVTKTATPGTDGSGGSGGSYSFGSYDETGNGGFSIVLDTRKYDTLKFTAGSGNATRIEVSVGGGDFQTLSSGTNTITISSANRTSSTRFTFNAFKSGGSGSTGASISGTVFQRRLPVNAFVGLDDPDSSAFVRNGQTDNLSPGEKKKKLEKQLRSSKEYLNKMFGKGMPNTATTIADYEPQQSYADIAASYPKRDPLDKLLKDIDDADKKIPPANDPNPPNRRGMGDRWKGAEGPSDTEIASARGPYGTPGADKPYVRRGYKDKDGKFVDFDNPATWPSIVPKLPRAQKKQRTMVAHHEPQGETIMEKNKKSFNDLTKKIPGYYDGKPAPLGFPIVEPPKMKNGMHPDLVDGKKTAKRFNRLDPVSAKAMPKTGNSHIDKKVRAAAKKPK